MNSSIFRLVIQQFVCFFSFFCFVLLVQSQNLRKHGWISSNINYGNFVCTFEMLLEFICWIYQPLDSVFLFYNKSANNSFSHSFSAKEARLWSAKEYVWSRLLNWPSSSRPCREPKFIFATVWDFGPSRHVQLLSDLFFSLSDEDTAPDMCYAILIFIFVWKSDDCV